MPIVSGTCLCSTVAWETVSPIRNITHCHCSRCRKTHGTAFGTYAIASADGFRLTRGQDAIVASASSSTFTRSFCRHCGGPVPDGKALDGRVGIPAGSFDDDPVVRPAAHLFVGSQAPWYTITDALPRFDGYPAGFNLPAVPDPPKVTRSSDECRGSCLCGGVAFVVDPSAPIRVTNCHCTRCRKARGAAHASNLVVPIDALTIVEGADRVATFRLPAARFFAQAFCRDCGAKLPRVDGERGIAIAPLGALDNDPGVTPWHHIFVGSMAPWFTITDTLPRFVEHIPNP